MKNIVQVAGVIDLIEAKMLIDCGVEYLGFPLRLPVNAVDHSEQEAKNIIAQVGHLCNSVIITYQSNAIEIINFLDYLGATIIQLHGDISLSELKHLKQLRPDIQVFKSIVIGKISHEQLISTITELSEHIDAFITDSYNPKTGASGATGITHDWSISKEIVRISPKPVVLAGGLNPGNVFQSIAQVKPAGVDVHTGVEVESGRKQQEQVRSFITEANRAFAGL